MLWADEDRLSEESVQVKNRCHPSTGDVGSLCVFVHLPSSISWLHLHRCAYHETPRPPRAPDTTDTQRNSSLALKQWLRVSCSNRKRSRSPIYSCWNYRSGGRWHSMCGNSGALLYPRPSALVEDITASRPKDSWDWGQTKRRAAIVLTGSPSSSPIKTHRPQELLLSVCDISRVTFESREPRVTCAPAY